LTRVASRIRRAVIALAVRLEKSAGRPERRQVKPSRQKSIRTIQGKPRFSIFRDVFDWQARIVA